MLKVVIDTNIIVSAFISPNGNSAKVLNLCRKNKADIYYNDEIMYEYEDVLFRPHFKFDIEEIKNTTLTELRKTGIFSKPAKSSITMPDEADRIFYDTAKENGAILITGNKKHYPDEQFILSPTEFLEKFS